MEGGLRVDRLEQTEKVETCLDVLVSDSNNKPIAWFYKITEAQKFIDAVNNEEVKPFLR